MPETEISPHLKRGSDHPFNHPEQYQKLLPGVEGGWLLWQRVSRLWRERQGQVTPEEVIGLYHNAKRKERLWPQSTLYDAWLRATWEADAYMWGGPKSIPNEKLGRYAQLDQIAALIEEAMDLAGQRPSGLPKSEFPT